jgi:hypothetical protein
MANNPLNLALRFVLELVALGGLALLGSTLGDDGWELLPAIGLPIAAAAAWGILRVPDDPGPAPVAVPGPVRLALEVVVFGGGVVGFGVAGHTTLALVVGVVMAGHYIVSYDRVLRLLRDQPAAPQS